MDKYPWLLPVALIAAGIKCILLYAGVITIGFGALGAVFGLSPLQTILVIALVLGAPGGWFAWRWWRYPDDCPVPTRWFKVFKRESEPAHARLVKADPSPNSTLERAPERLTLWFGAPIQPALSEVKLTDASGAAIATGGATAPADDATTLTVELPHLAPGAYTVVWRSLAAANGLSVGGSFKFSVGEALGVGAPVSATQ